MSERQPDSLMEIRRGLYLKELEEGTELVSPALGLPKSWFSLSRFLQSRIRPASIALQHSRPLKPPADIMEKLDTVFVHDYDMTTM